jgi:hypothetical protein
VIPNAVDGAIFHAAGRVAFDRGRRARLIAVSWSDNANKGGPTYEWLDGVLDRDCFEFTFVGRIAKPLRYGETIAPLPSFELAKLLRRHDVFVTASLNDPCSNALLEGLACGLPVLYARSGGHPELVGEAGFGFDNREELPPLLDRLVDEYEFRQSRIETLSLGEVADRYLVQLDLGDMRDR